MLSKGNYRIDIDTVLGSGSFGVVHPATHKFGRKVAAKRINTNDQLKANQIAADFAHILCLTHKNIARVFDVTLQNKSIWVFMELCEHGDLVNYLKPPVERKEAISDQEKLKLMLDIATGVEYLHSRNVVHRDIKPSNVLISGIPAMAKLTDFDLSKFFDDPISTSLMTSNVGTQAFKAPEFFQRTSENKINYHRTVDIYALGLTFLGMVQDNPFLFPKVETPNEPSELYVPAGLLMWERNTYRKEPLALVKPEECTETDLWSQVRKVIAKMTCFESRDRISADEVVGAVSAIVAQSPPEGATAASSARTVVDISGPELLVPGPNLVEPPGR